MWLIAIALIGGTAIALRYAGGYRRVAGVETASVLPPNIALRLKKIRAAGREGGKQAWTLQADIVDTNRDRNQVTFSGNIVVTLLSEGQSRATLNADFANYQGQLKTLVATGKVNGIFRDPNNTANSLQIATDYAFWNIGTREVRCPNKVTITLPNGVVRGTQFVVDLQTRNFELNDTVGEFYLEPDETPRNSIGELLPTTP
jgi:LPS export ABC transporter protein LptC